MLMDFDPNIRLVIISDKDGKIEWSSKRSGDLLKVPLAETKYALKKEAEDWMERTKFQDRNIVGKGLYHITAFEKTKRVTMPIDAFHLLFISVNNEPMKNTKKKSYGKLVEMGKILSIVEFVNTVE